MRYPDGYRKRRALVLGASGFIGRWVARELTAAGADLVLAARDPHAIAALAPGYGLRGNTHQVDLEQPGAARRLIAAVRPDIVFNLAGYGVDRSERLAARARRINTELVEELLSALAKRPETDWPGLALVHAGSALEYGEVGGNLDEATHPNPTTDYGRTKLAGTQLVVRAVAEGSLAAVTARLFTVYGPGEPEGRLLPTLLQGAASDGSIPLTAGAQQRDFTFVADVAEGLLRLGLLPEPTYSVVNLATGKLCQVKDFVLEAARVLRIDSNRLGFGVLPSRPDDMRHSEVHTARLHGLLRWGPSTDLEGGIRATAEFLRRMSGEAAKGGRDGV